jgi:hypothetical protein
MVIMVKTATITGDLGVRISSSQLIVFIGMITFGVYFQYRLTRPAFKIYHHNRYHQDGCSN